MDFEDLIGEDKIVYTHASNKVSKTRMYRCLIRGIQDYIDSPQYQGTEAPKNILAKWQRKLNELESANLK
jgi:hypothetical protein